MEITLELIVFTVLALFIGVSAILAVTTRRILRAATYLLFVLFGTAGIYFQLNYSFLGAVQLLIYAGGITVLYVFSILLTSSQGDKAEDLKGKIVGYASGTSSEAILNKTLASAGLTMDDITAMEMDASGIVSAMISGSLDACALWSPSTLAVSTELGDDVVKLADNLSFADQSASVSSWICMSKYADEKSDVLLRYVKALYKAKDYRADPANAEQISHWIADQCALDYETVYAQRGDAEWLTSAEMVAEIEDGTMEKLYKSQQNGFIASGDVEAEVPVSDYVMFDLMLEAAK